MGEWRFYAQRAETGLWLDTNVQLADHELTWSLSAPNSGKALIPTGIGEPYASDGEKTWGKMNTYLYAEEDGNLAWIGICTAANPDDSGLQLEFIGPVGWLQRVPFDAVYSVWRTNVFDVVRMLVNHSKQYRPHPSFTVPNGDSSQFVGDVQPPDKPKQPQRKKGEKKSDYEASDRYKDWQKDMDEWTKKYSDREKFILGWYEAPYVGEEIDNLAAQNGFEYRERVAWKDRGLDTPEIFFDFADDIRRRREDIAFVDGLNLTTALDPKDGAEEYANHVITLGAGEGRAMVRSSAGVDDGRLYQSVYIQYKSVRTREALRRLAQRDLDRLSQQQPKLDKIAIRDVPGYASVSSLRVGDEVKTISENASPPVNAWTRVIGITRNTGQSTVDVLVEVVG